MTDAAAPATPAAEAASAQEAAAPPPQAEAAPSRAETERAKLESLLARNAERKAKLAEREKALAEREARAPRPEKYREDPIAALGEMGLSPVEALDALVSHTNREGTELGKFEREVRDQIKALTERAESAERIAKELAEERAREREERATQASAETVRRAEEQMIEHLRGEAYGDLATFYTPEELIPAAHQIAETLQREGKRVTLDAVGARILEIHKKSIARFRPSSDASPAAPVTAPSSSAKPKTLTPDMAASGATKTSREMPWEERLRLIAERESRR